MTDVFISYATPDRPQAAALAEALSEQGLSVWWDRTIPAGESFDKVIEHAIEQAQSVVVLWSQASVDSDWVKSEAAEGNRRKILVPALIEEVKIPLEFRRIQAADLTDWEGDSRHPGWRKLIDSIRSRGKRRPDSATSTTHTRSLLHAGDAAAHSLFDWAWTRQRALRRSAERNRTWLLAGVIAVLAAGTTVALIGRQPVPADDAAQNYRCAQRAGFDCAKAASAQERAICADPDLARIDGCMLVEYNRMLWGIPKERDFDRLRETEAQKAWLRRRELACPEGRTDIVDCLRKEMIDQIEVIRAKIRVREAG